MANWRLTKLLSLHFCRDSEFLVTLLIELNYPLLQWLSTFLLVMTTIELLIR